jgi:flavodoxin
VNGERKPKVLLVYYTFSQQTGRVAKAMADRFEEHGCEVTSAALEFTDPKHSKIFTEWPMRLPALRIPTLLVPQRRRKTGEIAIPPEAQEGDYDLVVIGSPTWWLTVNMPVRSYLESPAAKSVLAGTPFAAYSTSRRYWKGNMTEVQQLGEEAGGTWAGETHFLALGNQVTSMLAWLAFMKRGEPRKRLLGLELPPPNLRPDFETQARAFVDGLADRVLRLSVSGVRATTAAGGGDGK